MLLRESIELESVTMPGVICVLASEPWGPVRIETAASAHDLLSLGVRPAYFADVGGRDLGQVVALVKTWLPPADGLGLIKAGLDRATAAVAGAFSAVSASHVADEVGFASPGVAVAALATALVEAEPAPACEASRVAMARNDDMPAGRLVGVTACRPARKRAAGPEVDVREIRGELRMTQDAFAEAFRFSIGALRDWEQHRSEPDSAALTLLRVIRYNPDMVRQALCDGMAQ